MGVHVLRAPTHVKLFAAPPGLVHMARDCDGRLIATGVAASIASEARWGTLTEARWCAGWGGGRCHELRRAGARRLLRVVVRMRAAEGERVVLATRLGGLRPAAQTRPDRAELRAKTVNGLPCERKCQECDAAPRERASTVAYTYFVLDWISLRWRSLSIACRGGV